MKPQEIAAENDRLKKENEKLTEQQNNWPDSRRKSRSWKLRNRKANRVSKRRKA